MQMNQACFPRIYLATTVVGVKYRFAVCPYLLVAQTTISDTDDSISITSGEPVTLQGSQYLSLILNDNWMSQAQGKPR